MKKILATCWVILSMACVAQANEAGYPWDKAPVRINDQAALQNGAKLFVNYCLNCHSAAYMRYNRLKDIGLTDEQIKSNLLFTAEKVGETMKIAMDPKSAKEWFGAAPPDLTVIARSRAGHGGTGADYIYTYLRTYYRDPNKATGWNNMVFPNVGMPHVLWELQGERAPKFKQVKEGDKTVEHFEGWEQVKPGLLKPEEYDQNVADLVTYLQWMGEPAQTKRTQLGMFVILFLAIFSFIAYRLNKAYWKDVK